MARDSYLNIAIRIARAGFKRCRGVFYSYFNVFNFEAGRFYCGPALQVIGGQDVLVKGRLKMGGNCRVETFCTDAKNRGPKIIFDGSVSIGNNVHLASCSQIRIGNGVLMGSNILVTDHGHGNSMSPRDVPPLERPLLSKGPIQIGENVWIGDGAVILGGVSIGRGAIVAANAVVRCDVPPGTTMF